MNKLIIVVFTLLIGLTASEAQNWEQTFGPELDGIAAIQTQDGNYLALANNSGPSADFAFRLIKTNTLGIESWSNSYFDNNNGYATDLIETSNGNLLITGLSGSQPFLLLLDNLGATIWLNVYSNLETGIEIVGQSVIELNNGNFLFTGGGGIKSNFSYAYITDPSGTVLQVQKLIEEAANSTMYKVIQTSEGGFLFVGYHDSALIPNSIVALKTDENLTQEWIWQNQSENSTKQHAVVEYEDHFYILGIVADLETFANTPALIKLTNTGEETARTLYSNDNFQVDFFKDMILAADNTFVAVGQRNSNLKLLMQKMDLEGNILWSEEYGYEGWNTGRDIFLTNNGEYLIAGFAENNASGSQGSIEDTKFLYLVKTDQDGTVYSNDLQGYIAADENQNCIYEDGETPLAGWIVKAEGNGQFFYGTSNEDGFYNININPGEFVLSLHSQGDYWLPCQDDINVSVTAEQAISTANIAMEATLECPQLSVDVSTPILRRCFDNFYTVQYCNYGTIPAEDASIILTLDPFLNIEAAELPYVDLGDQQFEFDLGDVAIGECNTFVIRTYLGCETTQLGQVHCVSAVIFPDDACIAPSYVGPLITIEEDCDGENVIFTIRNLGGAMDNTLNYIVIEDNIILLEEPYNLGAGASEQVLVEMATGSVYHLEAEQDPALPNILGDSYAVATLINCANTSPNYENFFWFPEEDDISTYAEDCQENIGSYDPNDKRGYPAGFGDQHLIRENTSIEYKIRFQNTGTDTAFTVVIEDQISSFLDISTIRPGAASHPFEWDIVNDKLIFTFNNILLPDSNINEIASHGFVKFKIDQVIDNPLGTQILNDAAIFFDFNEPVITNETFHIIGQDFVLSNFNPQGKPTEESVIVYPNPFERYTTFEVAANKGDEFYLELYDFQGRLIYRNQFSGNTYKLDAEGLPTGIYVYKINSENTLIGTGKVIMK